MKNQVQKQVSNWQISLDKRGVTREAFRVIKEVLYPNVAKDETLLMAIDYCKARNLDIMKRSIQIVPIWNKNKKCMEDTIWASIAEIRTTATRTGQYAGKTEAEFGEEVTEKIGIAGHEITYPKWCKITVFRLLQGIKCEFTAKLFWKESFKSTKDGTPNAMWQQRKYAQLEKCTEAAALRSAFPEEVGNDYIGEEAFSNENIKDITPSKTANIPDNLVFECDKEVETEPATEESPPVVEVEPITGLNAIQPNPANTEPLTEEEKKDIEGGF